VKTGTLTANTVPPALTEEVAAFDRQAVERVANGFVPDWRNLAHVPWFYNNVWRDPEIARVHWGSRIQAIIGRAVEKGGRVLEVGCGMGMLSLELAREGLEVDAVDVSPESISIARAYRDSLEPLRGGFGILCHYALDIVHQFPHQDGSYDTIIFFRSLHHMPDIPATLARVHRWLKPGGYLLLSEPVRAEFTKESAFYATLLRTILPTWVESSSKLNRTWTDECWEGMVQDMFDEYRYQGENKQSPSDGLISESDLIKAVRPLFSIQDWQASDAFCDKLLGGLRGPDRYDLARFLKFIDDKMVGEEILPGTSVEVFAVKE